MSGALIPFLLLISSPSVSAGESGVVDPVELVNGSWDVLDSHFSDSNIWFVHVGELLIANSCYCFEPATDVIISNEMVQRFAFIENKAGSVHFSPSTNSASVSPSQSCAILGRISFDGGEEFLVRLDQENGELSLSSTVSEVELFCIRRYLPADLLTDSVRD